MTEHETSELLRGATRGLQPDIERLVAGGMARGRVRRRRRRAAGGAAALIGVVTVGSLAGLVAGGDDRAIDPASPSGTAAPSPLPDARDTEATSSVETPSGEAPYDEQPRALAIDAAAIPATFAGLEPGEVALLDQQGNPMDGFETRDARYEPGPDEPPPGIIADFTWNGSVVRVAVAPTMPDGGDSPLERCRAGGEGGNGECVVPSDGPGAGGVLQRTTDTGPPVDGAVTTSFVSYYTPDRWVVTVMSANATDFDGTITSDRPPFTLDELTDVATSDVWFTG